LSLKIREITCNRLNLRKAKIPKMKNFTFLFLILFSSVCVAQDKFELTPTGFNPVEIAKPSKTNEQLIESARAWADSYNKREYDIYDVSENSISIDGMKDNAFYYRNVGETYYFRIKYGVKLTFGANTITMTYSVKEIYQKKTLIKSTIADYFTPDGKLKEDFEDIKPSLEQTANNLLKSYLAIYAN